MRIFDNILRKLHNKKLQKSSQNESISQYYLCASRIYSTARSILFMLLTLFVAIAVIVNANADVHENVIYLFRDFNMLITSDSKDSETMDYIPDDRMNFARYKNGLCVLGNKNITIFTSTGRKTLHETLNYSEPRLKVGEKFVLAYDLGGMSCSLYNSTACLNSMSFEYPISGGDISDKGTYAIVTKNEKYTGVVNIYSSKSNLLATYEKDKYISDVSIDSQGSKIAVTSFTQKSGDFESELAIYSIGKEDVITVTTGNALPLKCYISDNEYISVIYNNMFCTYDRKGELKNKYEYSDTKLVYADSCDSGIVIVEKDKNNKNFIILFDTKGKMLYNNKINIEIKNIAYNNNYIYIASPQNIEVHNISNSSIESINVDFLFDYIVIKNDNTIVLCNRTRAENYYFKY